MGLGTNNPVQQLFGRGLHINGTDQTRIKLTNSNSGATANDGFDIIQENDSEIHIINHENAAIKFGTNAAEKVRITSDGVLKITGQTSTIETAGLTHHTNNNLYIMVEQLVLYFNQLMEMNRG